MRREGCEGGVTPGLVMPMDAVEVVLDVLRRRLPEHFAAFEVERGLEPGTIPMPTTIDHLAGNGFRLKEDTAPSVLVGIVGNADPPERTKDGSWDLTWAMGVEVTVEGRDRTDTLIRRDWYGMLVAECILDRVPRAGEPIDALALEDVDLVPYLDETTQRVTGQARFLFSVKLRQSLGRRLLPPDNASTTPGTPGGPPAAPYTPPQPWPAATDVSTTVTREPIER
jgi:hypothetical protein